MKEKTADIEGHRIKVGLDQHKSLSSSSSVKVGVSTETPIRNSGNKEGSSKNSLFVASSNHSNNGSNNNNNNTNNNNNFDDDYNEWDISIGDLIIDLDADIERQSEGDKSTADCTDKSDSTKTLPEASKVVSPLNPKQLADISDPVSVMSSNLKSNRLSSLSSSGSSSSAHSPLSASNNSSLVVPTTPNVSNTNGASSGTVHHHHHSHNQRNAYSVATNNTSTGNNASNKSSSLVEHHATVDKGLKMKIKRKNIGGKISETKHEIVSSDISPQACKPYLGSYDQNSNPMPNVASNNIPNSIHGPNSALSSSNSVITANTEGVQSPLGDMSVLPIAKSSKHSNKIKTAHREKKEKEKIKFDKEKLNIPISSGPIKMKPTPEDNSDSVAPTSSSQTGIPNITVKYSSTLSPTVILKPEETQRTTPNINNQTDKPENVDDNISEKKSVGTTTSISTLTDPECLGPCEPGTSVTLEGIVWQETEGGVLVVNVTWRGKTYVGTLLDCTKHDWAPPRMCESPTSDIESKSLKNTRGKRARNSFVADNSIDTRSVTSKLRNGKGRRTANSGYIPPSPAKSDSSLNSSKRKGRPSDLDLSLLDDSTKRNRISKPDNSDIQQPSSPILIECPEPNCSKKYKHINGLKYHQSHAHMGSTFNLNDSQDFDNTNSEPAAPCSSKDEASDSELNDSSMPDFGIKEISNSSEKFNNEFKNKLDNSDSCKTEKTYNNTPNNSHDIETKKLNNSANDELALESNKINAKSSDDHDKINPNSASQHDDNAINCDDLVKSFDEKNNEKNAPTDTECMSCDQPDDRFCDTNRDSVNISRDVIPSDNDLTSITKPANSIKPTIIPAITSSLNCKNVINAITTSNKVDDIANVPSPAYSDISDDTNNNDNTNELVLTQSNDKNDSSKELKKSQTPSNFSLSSFPSYFSQSQYITPTSTVDSKTRESTTKPLNETNEPPSDLSTDKSLQNSYPYSFFRFSSISSHDSKSVSENISKPNSSLDTRSSLSPSNKIECDSLTKDKTPENCKPTPKENDFREQPIVELQNLKNRIQNFAFDQGSLYDTQKRFISDSEKDKSKDKPKHSPQQPKPNLVKEEKEKNTTVKHEEGVKPTMETTGPPPPTNGYYYNPSFLSHTFPPISPFENMFRSSAMNHVVMGSPYGPHPSSFLHSQMRFPPMSALDGIAMANAVSRSSTHSPSSGPSTSNTSMKANSHHMSSLYNSNPKSDRGGILSPTSNHNSIPSSSHSLISSSAYHKSPNKDFTGQIIPSSHSVPVSSVSDQRSTLATVSASMHPPRHPLHSASHVGYPIFDPYSAMIVNHAANSVPMHPFTPK